MSEMRPSPFTIQQQIDFVAELRENFDNNQRDLIQSKRSPKDVAELFKLIHENLIAVKLHQLAQDVKYCDICNQPIRATDIELSPSHSLRVAQSGIICARCNEALSDHANQTLGIP